MKKQNLIALLLPLLLTSHCMSAGPELIKALMLGAIPVAAGAAIHYQRSYDIYQNCSPYEHNTFRPYGNGVIRGLVSPVVGNTMVAEFKSVAEFYSDNLDRFTDHKKPYYSSSRLTTFVKEEAKTQGYMLGAAVWPITALRLLLKAARR